MATHSIAAALLCLAACATPPTPAPSGPFALAGTSWLRNDDTDASPHYATLDFTADAASGNAGCNTWHASIIVGANGALRFGPAATTRMMCPGSSMQTERNFLPVLTRTSAYHLEGEELVFTGDNNAVVARFTCAQEPCPHAN